MGEKTSNPEPFFKSQLPSLYQCLLRLIGNEKHESILKNVINEKFRKQFYFFTCILLDYVAHDIQKRIFKNINFENMTAVFFRGVKKYLGEIPLK